MNGADLVALAPLAVLAGAAVSVMLAVAVRRSHLTAATIAVLGLAGTFVALAPAASEVPRRIGVLLVVDRFALTMTGLLALAAAGCVLLAFAYLRRTAEVPEELYILILLATFGAAVLSASDHLVALFVGLETLSVALYGAIGYTRDREAAAPAAMLYLVVAAASSAFLLFGAALLYAGTGTMVLADLVRGFGGADPVLAAGGIALVLVAVGFKLGAAPFHLWTPDVYRGAPAPVTAFVATVSKAGVVAVLLRLLVAVDPVPGSPLVWILGLLAVASIVVGNLLALREPDLKRLLAYSSVAHMGYLLVALLAGGERAVEAVLVYLVTYVVSTLGALGVVSAVADRDGERTLVEDYRGLAWRRPALAACLAASVASLAGVPLTAGFVGKLWAVLSAASDGLWLPVLALVAGSVVGVFYYLRVVLVALTPADEGTPPLPAVPVAASIVLVVAVALLLWFGIVPSAVLAVAGPAVSGLV